MSVTIVVGGQRVTVHPPDALPEAQAQPGEANEVPWDECMVGRGGRSEPVHIVLSSDRMLSRRAAVVRCVDGDWWQIRQVGRNGVTVQCANGGTLPVNDQWLDVPARYGEAYVTVTTPAQEHEFKVEHGASGVAVSASAGLLDESTRVVGECGYWRAAVALCEPFFADESDRIPTHGEIAERLDRLGLEREGFGTKAVEKRIGYLYRVTGIEPGRSMALRRRLVESGVVTDDDVTRLLGV